jgi:hypothetical protein
MSDVEAHLAFVREWANPHSLLMAADDLHEQALAQYQRRDGTILMIRKDGEAESWDRVDKSIFLLGGFALENAIKAFLVYENPDWVAGGELSRSLSCFAARSSAKFVSPVTLPPGWERLCTKPKPTGSAPSAITIGIVLVALRAARLAGTGAETITRGFNRTNSAAKSGRRSRNPSAKRYTK